MGFVDKFGRKNVLGSSRVVSSIRALTIGDKVSWNKYCGLSQHDLHSIEYHTALSSLSAIFGYGIFLLFGCLGCLQWAASSSFLTCPENKASLNRGGIPSLFKTIFT
ncbi:hypothetical protein NC652_022405 [Populus alba x Populus x berolinensis]|nr:hypothetical protein NC652_022405 [Populus alba x Populus x berolinensis]